MARKLTPGMVGTGGGWQTSNRDYQLTGVAGPPYIGVGSNPEAASSGWYTHVQQPTGAHPASAITRPATQPLSSDNVEGALDELSGALPNRPPMLGEYQQGKALTGIPYWGMLSLLDSDLITRGSISAGNDPGDVYPYYWKAVTPTTDEEFVVQGADPVTDELWNGGVSSLSLPGAWRGYAHAGGYTRSTGEVLRTLRVLPRSTTADPANPGFPVPEAVTLSGMISPADRGVLALFHFPPNGTLDPTMATYMADFISQPLYERVVAALLLGQGVGGSSCSGGLVPCGISPCDGSPGGIFGLGVDGDGNYDPFSYPGQAGGQYDLLEIHMGTSTLDGSPLRPPWDDLDGDTVPGAQREMVALVPAPGQVRLGTDPAAGEAPINFGLPILGGTQYAYTGAARALIPTQLIDGGGTENRLYSSLLPLYLGMFDTNFFAYRLPLLQSYQTEGLKWTPRGQDPYTTKEAYRYFIPQYPNSGNFYYPSGTSYSMAVAGYYGGEYIAGGDVWDPTALPNLGVIGTQDDWAWQVARFRHTFLLPVTEATGDLQDSGSYLLIHFKKEHDFEKFAVRGVGWWDSAEGYEVYGAHTLWTVAGVTQNLEHDGNVVNEETSLTAFAPAGPAPDYGYGGVPYHGLRSAIVMDPDGTDVPTWTSADYTWTTAAVAGVNEGTMRCSGVAYFVPKLVDLNTDSFQLTTMAIVAPGANWKSTYGVDYRALTSGSVAPALVSAPDPLLVDLSQYLGQNLSASTAPNAIMPVGANPATDLTPGADKVGMRYVDVPYTYCGAFNETTGPTSGDLLTAGFSAPSVLTFGGDQRDPVFCQNVTLRTFQRRPLLPLAPGGAILVESHGEQTLWHSTSFDKVVAAAAWDEEERGYGNFVTAGPPYLGYRVLFSKHKDYEERFLDETYRYAPSTTFLLGGSISAYNSAAAETAFHGPGMGAWVGGPIEFPVKAGVTGTPWCNASWTYLGYHRASLQAGDLQVAGWPDRDPPITDGAEGSIPKAGLLMYPKSDYTPYFPSGIHVAGGQPDYTGYSGNRYYIRALDLNFAHYLHTTTPAGASKVRHLEGSSTFRLRLDGIMLENFVYQAPGPGCLAALNAGLALQLKVPGLTTWMDAGRPDGAGPSKQDTLLDGAGCLVLGPNTYNFIDPVTKLVGCYIQVNVGPVATLFRNTGTMGGTYTDQAGAMGQTSADECPILVRVGMASGATGFDLKYRNIGNNNFLAPDPQHPSNDIRGLVGISVVHETVDTLLPPV